MADSIPYTTILERVKDDIDYIAEQAYAKGYNSAKTEIALSGEYERAYKRGKEDAERKKGEWVKRYKELDLCTAWWYECSECGYKPVNSMLTAFCPNCGAEMKGAENVENDKP